MGARDANNQPVGFDVDYCNDLAKALGVKTEIVETPFPDRVPALMSDLADVVIASTSDTLERAKVVGFSIPYMVNRMIVLTRKNTGISSYEDLKKAGSLAIPPAPMRKESLKQISKNGVSVAIVPINRKMTRFWRLHRGILTRQF